MKLRKKILIVEDNTDYAEVLKDHLMLDELVTYEVHHTKTLLEATEWIRNNRSDAILLDLYLADSEGFDTIEAILSTKPHCPVVILSAWEDAKLALNAIRAGVQDYIFKNEALGSLLSKTLRHAMERYQLESTLRRDAFYDELTGIYNRKGFQTYATSFLKLAVRQNKPVSVLFFDLDGLKRINDTRGHLQGDQAIQSAAQILLKTFRESDIVARIGGDEFAVLAYGLHASDAKSLVIRLHQNVEEFNRSHAYPLGMSYGISSVTNVQEMVSLDHLLSAADEELYKMKYQRKNLRETGS